MNDYSIFAGTIGLSLWRSKDGGGTWTGLVNGPFGKDAPYEAQFRGLAIDPRNLAVVYAGDEKGIYKTTDRGNTWEQLHGPFDGTCVWSLAVDPNNSNTIFAGTRPPALYRSKDPGTTWQKLDVTLPQVCSIGTPRMTTIRIDPTDSRRVWASPEKSTSCPAINSPYFNPGHMARSPVLRRPAAVRSAYPSTLV